MDRRSKGMWTAAALSLLLVGPCRQYQPKEIEVDEPDGIEEVVDVKPEKPKFSLREFMRKARAPYRPHYFGELFVQLFREEPEQEEYIHIWTPLDMKMYKTQLLFDDFYASYNNIEAFFRYFTHFDVESLYQEADELFHTVLGRHNVVVIEAGKSIIETNNENYADFSDSEIEDIQHASTLLQAADYFIWYTLEGSYFGPPDNDYSNPTYISYKFMWPPYKEQYFDELYWDFVDGVLPIPDDFELLNLGNQEVK